MIRLLLVAACAWALAACAPSERINTAAAAGAASPVAASAATASPAAQPRSSEPPVEIRIASSVGEVVFHHQAHVADFGVDCAECHHQINAKALTTPHPNYLQSSWVNCRTCHDDSGPAKPAAYSCAACHRTNPAQIADETLSAKVVVHRQCWKCHEVGTGQQASEACAACHSGKKTT